MSTQMPNSPVTEVLAPEALKTIPSTTNTIDTVTTIPTTTSTTTNATTKDGLEMAATTFNTTNKNTTSKYVRYFESIFVPVKVELLRNKAQSGQLRHCQFRSLCWRYFLNCLPQQYDDWLLECRRKRQEYEKIRDKHLSSINSKNIDEDRQKLPKASSVNPNIKVNREGLKSTKPSCDQNSVTNRDTTLEVVSSSSNKIDSQRKEDIDEERRYVQASKDCDHKNVFRTIERDVVRTFPDMEFFRQTEMQNIMSNILFNFACENPQLSYKQGMHELIATLLYVAHTDSQNCLIHYEGDYANETIATLLHIKYLEHDVYHLFNGLMKAIETWYQNDEILIVPNDNSKQLRSHNELINRSSTSRSKLTSTKPQVSSVLGLKLKKISENIVKSYDAELFYHLEALQIAPQIYGIRWMRLLFGREFEFLDLLTVWDAIICDQDPMSLVDYVFASMLITIREELVNSDYTNCLNKLMRYQFKDVTYVIKLALYLRDPINYSRPKAHNQLSYPKINNLKYRNPTSAPISKPPNVGAVSSLGSPRSAFDVSTESYDDLHSIVDYCWRLLSEQIDSLQRCLPKEKGLHSEDEIFVALAQLKKVRDVLKGSLRLEDELESAATVAGGSKNSQSPR